MLLASRPSHISRDVQSAMDVAEIAMKHAMNLTILQYRMADCKEESRFLAERNMLRAQVQRLFDFAHGIEGPSQRQNAARRQRVIEIFENRAMEDFDQSADYYDSDGYAAALRAISQIREEISTKEAEMFLPNPPTWAEGDDAIFDEAKRIIRAIRAKNRVLEGKFINAFLKSIGVQGTVNRSRRTEKARQR